MDLSGMLPHVMLSNEEQDLKGVVFKIPPGCGMDY